MSKTKQKAWVVYQWLFTHIGGRMWTYIIRDSYHDVPLLWLIGLVVVGAAIGHYVGWMTFLKFMGIFLVGVLAGHLFWGSRYIHEQGENK